VWHSARPNLWPERMAMPMPCRVPTMQGLARLIRLGAWLAVVLAVYAISAYLIIPTLWRVEVVRHPALQGAPRITHTAAGIHGDPLNIALVATEAEIVKAMLAAGWHPADPLTLETSLRIVGSTIFHRPYVDAPVSNLYLWGRKEDLAFEQPVGDDPARRHHVRFWRSAAAEATGRPLWMGAATYDARVGFSHTTGQITHHIAPDVDSERDKIIQDLRHAGRLRQVFWIEQFHQVLQGHNGGGDPYSTDGRLAVGVIVPYPSPVFHSSNPIIQPISRTCGLAW
jgi:LssY C-terminus